MCEVKEMVVDWAIDVMRDAISGLCGITRGRGYLEELSGKELSRVYPTENIEDLFEQFPNGFTVSQMRVVGDSNVFVYLEARGKREAASWND